MEGRVISGRYLGSYFVDNQENKAYIKTSDGMTIRLTPTNTLFIDDVSDSHTEYGGKVIMIMWDDTETSLILITNTVSQNNKTDTKEKKGTFEADMTVEDKAFSFLSSSFELILGLISLICIVIILSTMIKSCDFDSRGDDGAYFDWGPGYYWNSSSNSVERNIFEKVP